MCYDLLYTVSYLLLLLVEFFTASLVLNFEEFVLILESQGVLLKQWACVQNYKLGPFGLR